MSLPHLLSDYNKAKDEYLYFRDEVKVAFSEEAKQAFLNNPRSVCFKYSNMSREECLLEQWNDQKNRMDASLARKEDRMSKANYRYMHEKIFQNKYAQLNTGVDGKIICGYYKVCRKPTHYELVLMRSSHVLGDEIPSMVAVPLTTIMGEGEWHNVSPNKIYTS